MNPYAQDPRIDRIAQEVQTLRSQKLADQRAVLQVIAALLYASAFGFATLAVCNTAANL